MTHAPAKSSTQARAGESLVMTMIGLLERGDVHVGYADMSALLGTSWLVTAERCDGDVASWVHAGRDWRLHETADLLGIGLRDLHPRVSAGGLEGAPEFQDHFVDSYQPLIAAAIRSGQSVLAWQGWPTPMASSWGVITRIDESGVLRGVVAGDSTCVALAAAALQCYVVERVNPAIPDERRLLRHCLDGITSAATCDSGGPLPVLIGRSAYAHWRERLQRDIDDTDMPEHTAKGHLAVAASIAANRTVAVRFLRDHHQTLSAVDAPAATALSDRTCQTADLFADLTRSDDLSSSSRHERWSKFCETIAQAGDLDDEISRLAAKLAVRLQ